MKTKKSKIKQRQTAKVTRVTKQTKAKQKIKTNINKQINNKQVKPRQTINKK